MERIIEGADILLYRTRRRLLLAMGIVCALGVVVAHVLEFSLIAQLALAVVAAASIIIGLSAEQIRIDLGARRFAWRKTLGGFVTSQVDASLDLVEAVVVFGGMPGRDARRDDVRTSHRVLLRCDASIEPITIGLFASRDQAMEQAAFLCERLGVRLQQFD